MSDNEFATMNQSNYEQLAQLCAPKEPLFQGLPVQVCNTTPRDEAWLFKGDKQYKVVKLMVVR